MEKYSEEQIKNILLHYPTLEDYEMIKAQRYLSSTDYTVIKAYEYFLTGKQLNEEYTNIFNKREEAREIIRRGGK